MKPVATIILNRNLPQVTEALYENIERNNSSLTDIYVVESGSDEGNLSKYCSWWANWPESIEHGLRYPRGFNYALCQLLKESKYNQYDNFFLVCNDIEFGETPTLEILLEELHHHQKVGILAPCSPTWGERRLLEDKPTKYFWYITHTAWLVRRAYIDSIRELDEPSHMSFLYDGDNFRGYESEMELIVKGYVNDWASAITRKVMASENKDHLFTKADLIRTEPYEQSIVQGVQEGKKWLRKKYGFNSRWPMQMYSKFFYDKFFDFYPQLSTYKI